MACYDRLVEYLSLFLIGIFFGSFLKVLADRLPRGESPFGGRSRCEDCKHSLGVLDLIPVFSFLFLRGKCRYCKHKLGWEYPASEIIVGSVFAITYYLVGISNFPLDFAQGEQFPISHSASSVQANFQYLFYFFVVSGLLVILFADIKYYIIPFQILLPSLVIVVIYQALSRPEMMVNYLLAGTGAFIFFLLIFLLTRGRGMGFGDVIYSFYMGILLGFPGIVVGLYVAFLTGAVVSVILILIGKKKLKGGVIPFGPFLIFGTYIALFWGERLGQIALAYLNI